MSWARLNYIFYLFFKVVNILIKKKKIIICKFTVVYILFILFILVMFLCNIQ